MKIRKRIFNFLIILFSTILLGSVVLELSYRYQWFDFYKAELKGLNSKEMLESNLPKILVCGDSFTASPESYVKALRDSLNQYAVINAAVPGTGIMQHALYMPGRIEKYKPAVFIYQFYVGNDLFDISHPTSSSQISFTRKAYWWLSDRLLSISFLNFRFAGIRYKYYDDAGGAYKPKENDVFSVEAYSKREKFNYKAEPNLVENTLYLTNGRENDWKIFLTKFKKMVVGLPAGCRKYFIIVPHQSQLSATYLNNHIAMGASFSQPVSTNRSLEYPLYQKIKELCDQLDISAIDPLEKFRMAETTGPVYYANDPHLNKNGDEILSRLILDQLK